MIVEPRREEGTSASVELVIEGRFRDLGGFTVRRVLPSTHRRMVGPFIFFDQMGPATLERGHGVDVRPHPHISLATVTYLFEGEIVHRDSLGSLQPIRPGDVNWMTAGRGIAHSERTSPEERARGPRLHGIQCWVALPNEHEETAPEFHHHPAATMPAFRTEGAEVRLIAGSAYGRTSPVRVYSPMFYLEARFAEDGELTLPDDHEERAAYVVEGVVRCDGRSFEPGAMIVLRPGIAAKIGACAGSRVMLLGGARVGERHIWWNFVSSSEARIERAKRDWEGGLFPIVPGDEQERIPLPES